MRILIKLALHFFKTKNIISQINFNMISPLTFYLRMVMGLGCRKTWKPQVVDTVVIREISALQWGQTEQT